MKQPPCSISRLIHDLCKRLGVQAKKKDEFPSGFLEELIQEGSSRVEGECALQCKGNELEECLSSLAFSKSCTLTLNTLVVSRARSQGGASPLPEPCFVALYFWVSMLRLLRGDLQRQSSSNAP